MSEPLLSQYSSQEEPAEPIEWKPLGFIDQTALLVFKNYKLTIKNPKNIIFLILTPFLLSAFMAGFQSLARDNGQRVITEPNFRSLPSFPRCRGSDCISLEYLIIAGSTYQKEPTWVKYTLKHIMESSGLSEGDIKSSDTIKTTQQLREYYDSLPKRPVQIGIMFCVGPIDIQQQQLAMYCDSKKTFGYYLVVSKTDALSVVFQDLLEPFPINPMSMTLKLLIDNAILNFLEDPLTIKEGSISLSTSQFPVTKNRYIQGYEIVSAIGAFYYIITPLFAFLFIQSEIVREKEYRLRQGLNIFGASHAAYWVSWFIVAIFYSFVVAIATELAGFAFGFGFFTDTPAYFVIFFLFAPFTLAMQAMSMFLSTLSPTMKTANAVSYAIVLFAIVVQAFVSDNNFLQFLFTDDVSSLIVFLKYFLSLYPPFSFTKIFTSITEYSGKHFDFKERRWVSGIEPYTMTAFTSERKGPMPIGTDFYTRYSDFNSFLILLMDIAFYAILVWYFDRVAVSNRGRGDSPIFFIKDTINFIKRKMGIQPAPFLYGDHRNVDYKVMGQEESTTNERMRVYKNSQEGLPALGMRIKSLSKTFKGFFDKTGIQAIRDFTLQIEPDELMCILGHNGAGKTTLINILTGVIEPNSNPDLEIIINNKSLDNIDQIRKYIGVCSQFDILWGELTAEQHLYLFSRLKNIPLSMIPAKIDEMLGFVSLSREKKNTVSSFSGGMKRRLSLAIAAIGDPKIILLDEPTTGLDPKVRQQVWDLVEKLKAGKSIILTTHSMEEADILADRLCVMVKGRLQCVGTSFYLKKKYGEGHRIAFNTDSDKIEEAMQLVRRLFPAAKEVDCKGGNMILGFKTFDGLLKMVKMLENNDSLGLNEHELKQLIRDWSVSHSTLEDVFMKVTKEKEE